jgi:hypothetical protein
MKEEEEEGKNVYQKMPGFNSYHPLSPSSPWD